MLRSAHIDDNFPQSFINTIPVLGLGRRKLPPHLFGSPTVYAAQLAYDVQTSSSSTQTSLYLSLQDSNQSLAVSLCRSLSCVPFAFSSLLRLKNSENPRSRRNHPMMETPKEGSQDPATNHGQVVDTPASNHGEPEAQGTSARRRKRPPKPRKSKSKKGCWCWAATKTTRPPSPAWDHFTKKKADDCTVIAKCKYCGKEYMVSSQGHGTELNSSIACIRDLVGYVMSSLSRYDNFMKCAEKEKIDSRSGMCLDVPTRWNSTYLMLEAAQIYQRAFGRLWEEDSNCKEYMKLKAGERVPIVSVGDEANEGEDEESGSKKIPNKDDWDNCRYLKFCFSHLKGETVVEVDCPGSEDDKFDILGWWKSNSSKYPLLSQIARDVLVVPVSTVASESAFSTGGQILDPFHSSLSPMMIETLACSPKLA
ncbi:hypothetical protein Acr_00g0099890 [Actinidia rufa]|uniref:HAT C-terminal dimerisation domain-containing protein n=1 Tax=Actinidia rufa TaxID=165716 RepID=A0A7J0DZM7_9ERIC|nr:hypothetical protein Acr_00g0099890 [Actinidia rufa]